MNPVTKIIAVRTVQMSALGALAHFLLHWPFTGPLALGFFLSPALCLYFVFVFAGTWTWGLPILTRLPPGDNALALTFDDGPSQEATPLILDILRLHETRATFFVLGEAVDRQPDLLRRIVAEGHAVGIHAYTHQPFVLQSRRAIVAEIRQTETAIRRACPEAKIVSWVRPPHGFKSITLLGTLRRTGYGLAAWSADSRDYDTQDAAQITAHALKKAHAGAIVLLHDGRSNAATAAALPQLLRALAARDLVAVPLPNWVSFP